MPRTSSDSYPANNAIDALDNDPSSNAGRVLGSNSFSSLTTNRQLPALQNSRPHGELASSFFVVSSSKHNKGVELQNLWLRSRLESSLQFISTILCNLTTTSFPIALFSAAPFNYVPSSVQSRRHEVTYPPCLTTLPRLCKEGATEVQVPDLCVKPQNLLGIISQKASPRLFSDSILIRPLPTALPALIFSLGNYEYGKGRRSWSPPLIVRSH